MVSDKPLVPSSHGGGNVVLQDLTPIFNTDIDPDMLYVVRDQF